MTRTLSDLLRSFDIPPQLHDRLARVVYNLGGGRVPFVFTTSVNSPILTTTELVVLTTPPLNPGIDSAVVLLLGYWNTNALSAAATFCGTTIRRGTTIASPVVNAQPFDRATASTGYTGFAMQMDTPGAVAGQQYALTAIVGGASGNTAVISGFFAALALG